MSKMESKKRKPLSDITNTYNLIPTSALRELVAASSNTKPPLSIFDSNSTSSSKKFCSQSSNRSNTSIGSSNVSATSNARTVQFRNPPHAISSITSRGGMGSKDVAYSRSQIIEKSKKEREADFVVSRTPVEKSQDKGKAIAVPFISSPTKKMKGDRKDIYNLSAPVERQNQKGMANLSLPSGSVEIVKESGKGILKSYSHSIDKTEKGKAIAVPFSSSPTEKMKDKQNNICNPSALVEKHNQKGVANLSLSSGSVDMVKESVNGILNSYPCSFEKKEKGKAILNSSACALGEQTEVGKGIDNNSSCSLRKATDGKEGTLKHSRSSILKVKDIWQDPSSFLVERAKNKGSSLNISNSSHEKTREKRKTILQPSDIVDIANHKGSSAAVAVKSHPPRRRSERKKNDAGASSCPPVTRTKNIRNDLDEAGDIKYSKSCTDPHPKCRKNRCSRIENTSKLPEDFVKQQKAYFDELDEFELPVEEVTLDELE